MVASKDLLHETCKAKLNNPLIYTPKKIIFIVFMKNSIALHGIKYKLNEGYILENHTIRKCGWHSCKL